jgi:hypothetical protein
MDNVLTFTVHGGQANLTVEGPTTTLVITGERVMVEISVNQDAVGFSIPAQPGTVTPVALPQATKAATKAAKAAGTKPAETSVWRWPANLERPDNETIRTWALGQKGLKVGRFGRLSFAVMDAYILAHAK